MAQPYVDDEGGSARPYNGPEVDDTSDQVSRSAAARAVLPPAPYDPTDPNALLGTGENPGVNPAAGQPTGEFANQVNSAAVGLESAARRNPASIIPGAAEGLVAGIGGMGEAAATGLAGVARGAQSLASGEDFGPGFAKGAAWAQEKLKPLAELLEPETDVGKATLNVLGLLPGAAHAAGEQTFESTQKAFPDSPKLAAAAGAGVEALGNLAMLVGVPDFVKPPKGPTTPRDFLREARNSGPLSDILGDVEETPQNRAAAAAVVAGRMSEAGHNDAAVTFARNAADSIKNDEAVDLSTRSLTPREPRAPAPDEGAPIDSTARPEGQLALPAPEDVGRPAEVPTEPAPPTEPSAPPAAPVDPAAELHQTVADAASGRAVARAGERTAAQIELNQADPMASIKAIAAAPITPIGSSGQLPGHVDQTAHANAAGDLAAMIVHADHLDRQAAVTPPEGRQAVLDQAAAVRQEAQGHLTSYAAANGPEAATHLHATAATVANGLRPTIQAPRAPEPVQESAPFTKREQDERLNTLVNITPEGMRLAKQAKGEEAPAAIFPKIDRDTFAKAGLIRSDERTNSDGSKYTVDFVDTKTIKDNSDAIRERSAGAVLQREPSEAGSARGERGRVEQGVEGKAPPAAREEKAPVEGNREQPSEVIPAQTEAQKSKPATAANILGDNAALDHERVGDMNVAWENRVGTVRRDLKEGKWEQKMHADYGRIKSTQGADGEAVDIFHGRDGEQAFVVDQNDPKTGKFDEHKLMYGYPDIEAAKAGYLKHYPKGWQGLGNISPISPRGLKVWLDNGDLKKPYAGVQIPKSEINLATGDDLRGWVAGKAGAYATPGVLTATAKATAPSLPLREMTPSAAQAVLLTPSQPIDAMNGAIPGSQARLPTPEERLILGAALSDLDKMGVPVFMTGDGVFAYTAFEGNALHLINSSGYRGLGVRANVLKAASEKPAWTATLRVVLGHEIGHAVSSRVRNGKIEFAIDASPRMEFAKVPGGGVTPIGDVARELVDYFKTSLDFELPDFLDYPLRSIDSPRATPHTIANESFAQLFTLWYHHNALMKAKLPLAHALMKEVTDAIRSASQGKDRASRVQRVEDAVFQVLSGRGAAADGARADNGVGDGRDDGRAGEREAGQGVGGASEIAESRSGARDRNPVVSHAVAIREGAATRGLPAKPSIIDVANYFNSKSSLSYDNPKDVAKATRQMFSELKYQLSQPRSGLGWYSGDVAKAWKVASQLHPDLATDPVKRQLASIVTGIMSPGTLARVNFRDGLTNWAHYEQHGEFSELNPITRRPWGVSKAREMAIRHINHMLADSARWGGADNAERAVVEWLLTEHPANILHAEKARYGVFAGKDKEGVEGLVAKADLLGGATDMHLGVSMFGPKVGPFVGNMNGMTTGVTVDVWATRSLRRLFGTLPTKMRSDGKVDGESPTTTERAIFSAIMNQAAQDPELRSLGIQDGPDGQGVEWFFEQQLYDKLMGGTESGFFSDGAREYVESNGHAVDESRLGDATLAEAAIPERKSEASANAESAELRRERLAEHSGPTGAASYADFKEDPESALKKQGWAILNANVGDHASPDSVSANRRLEKDLTRQGIEHHDVTGHYKGADEGRSFLIFANEARARALAKKYGQESALTSNGLVYSDGSPNTPAVHEKTVVGPEARKQDFYTTLPDGTDVSMGLDFGNDAGVTDIQASQQMEGDGRGFTKFFEAASRGERAPDVTTYTPVHDISSLKEFSDEYVQHRGNFDDHIATSIPGFREVQQAVGDAIVKMYGDRGGTVLDIGGSEGAFNKAITAVSDGRIQTLVLDPNTVMAKFFEDHSQVPGAEYDVAALGSKEEEGKLAWTEDDGTKIKFFKPIEKYDVVHEAMVFQFISNTRNAQLARVKELMKPRGIALFEEKVIDNTPQWKANEAQKDAYKARYYSQAQIAAKKAEVLAKGADAAKEAESQAEQKVVGMNDLMVSTKGLEEALTNNWRHVAQYWDSGNFKGYVASDDPLALDRFLGSLVPLDSEYAKTATPRDVTPARSDTTDIQASAFQEDTPEFKKWFGDSKVVDEEGRPLVVYHGTLGDIKSFDKSKQYGGSYYGPGFYFTTSSVDAGENYGNPNGSDHKAKLELEMEQRAYDTDINSDLSDEEQNALQAKIKSDFGWKHEGAVMPVYLRMKKPWVIGKYDEATERAREMLGIEGDTRLAHADDRFAPQFEANEDNPPEAFSMAIRKMGFDGIIDHEVSRFNMEGTKGGTAHYIVFQPNQVKSAIGNSGAFGRTTDIAASAMHDEPLWHSGLQRAIDSPKAPFAKDNTAPAKQLALWLDARAKDGTFSPRELAWTGLTDFLRLKEGKVTRDEVNAFLDQNGVKVEEKMLGEDYADAESWWNDEGGANEETPFSELTHREQIAAEGRYLEEVGQYQEDGTRYHEHQLPGGKNYRELLLTLPRTEGAKRADSMLAELKTPPDDATPDQLNEFNRRVAAYHRAVKESRPTEFRSTHFAQPNILAHVRFNERTDANGKKVLFIEEIQSDWAQKGRKEGFRSPPATPEEMAEHGELMKKSSTMGGPGLSVADMQRIKDIEHKAQFSDRGIPAAPFVGKTEAWVALALKRMIRYAADNGFDRVAWTNGEQQAARYDLSKQVDSISVFPPNPKGFVSEGRMNVHAYKGGERVIAQSVADQHELEGLIGKDAAQKAMDKIAENATNPRGTPRHAMLSGLDLKVGGEGMKSFYDKIVPNVANDVLKKLGGGRVGDVEFDKMSPDAIDDLSDEDFHNMASGQESGAGKQQGFDITPGMLPKAKSSMDIQASGYDLYGDLEQPERKRGSALDAAQKLLAPASRGPIAEQEAGIMRHNLAQQARAAILAGNKFKAHAAMFNKMPVREQIAFINSYEKGREQPTPELQAAAAAIKAFNLSKVRAVQALGTGKLEEFDTNYLGRIWKHPDRAQAFFGKRPLEGAKGFLKRRTFQYFVDGINAGFEPVTFNPVEMMLLKGAEVDRYVYGQRIIGEMHSAGLTRLVPFGEKPPEGWTKINDKIAQAGSAGFYCAPDEAATLINNHLSPSLQGNAVYDLVRKSGMLLNSAQLGLSAFHLGFTTLDSMVSRVALANQQLSRGVIQGSGQQLAAGLGGLLQGANPLQPFVNLMKGDRLFRAYMGDTSNPAMSAVVDALLAGGGRVRLDDFYRNATINAFRQAVKRRDIKGVLAQALPTALDKINAPIFEYLVPRQKLGVFFDMANDWLKRNPGASQAATRAAMGKFWDSVDNRLGQLVYDNVFWHRALKDALMISVRSVGWNLGTFRELGGGVADIRKVPKEREFSPRLGYVLALPMLVALYGSILGYLYTGQGPKELKDMFFPKTGKKRPDGSDDRISLPSYMKDIYAYAHDITDFVKYGSNPFSTVQNKLHPLLGMVSQMLNNQDFFGAAIRSPGDPIMQQLKDEAKYIAAQLTPFGVRNYAQQQKTKGQEASVPGYLTSPAMVGITPAPGYITKTDQQTEAAMASRMKDSLISKFRQELRDGADRATTVRRAIAAGLRQGEVTMILHQGMQQGQTKSSAQPRKFGG